MSQMQRATHERTDRRFDLRLLSGGDAALYRSIYCDADTMRYVGAPLSQTAATASFEAALRLNDRRPALSQFLVILNRLDAREEGICGIRHGVPRLGAAEIGMMLKGSAREQGYSHEILGHVMDHVFQSSAVEAVWVRYLGEHVAAERLVAGLGFEQSQLVADDDPRRWAHLDRVRWSKQSGINNRGNTCPK